jgi:hypothetical protein
MIRNVVAFLGLLVLLPALQAGDKPEKQTPAQQYQALVKEFRKATEEYPKALANAKTREEKQKVFQEKFPWPDKFAPRFLELAEKNPKNPAAVDALVWIVTHVRVTRDPQSSHKAFQILLRDHVQSEKMATLNLYPLANVMLGYAYDKDSQQLLHAVLEKSKHHRAQAFACLALAEQAEGCLRLAREFKDDSERAKRYEEIIGKEAVEALLKADPDKLSKEAESFYERVVKDFADVVDPGGGRVGEKAKEKLEVLRHPVLVGKAAPEIEGEDIDGKGFKLSDYRGKVILLDFWGNW